MVEKAVKVQRIVCKDRAKNEKSWAFNRSTSSLDSDALIHQRQRQREREDKSMALSLRLLANVLLVVASSSSSSRLPTKASSSLLKLPNKVDAVASCSKTGLRKAVAEVRYDSMRTPV